MPVVLNPYLGFTGNAREALEFYHAVFGGDLTISTFAENGMPEAGDGVMHGQLTGPAGLTLMASDSPTAVEGGSSSISISLSGDDDAALRGYWEKLSEGASIAEPLATAPWGDTFGMLTDRFGTAWMVNISGTA
jgi:PhnB protein